MGELGDWIRSRLARNRALLQVFSGLFAPQETGVTIAASFNSCRNQRGIVGEKFPPNFFTLYFCE